MTDWNPKDTLDAIGVGRKEKKRPARVAEAVKEELSLLLLQKIRDPDVAGISIARVEVSDDLKYAKIHYRVRGGDKARRLAAEGLDRARGFMRSHLAKTLNLRYTPALQFYYDETGDKVEEVEQLLRDISEENRSNEDS
ncbi:MAG: 30S ribosome-binding factor RbfA [Desulfopila sp.]